MPATALPAVEMLRLIGGTSIKWAQFDPDWYLANYPAVRDQLGTRDPETILDFYIKTGQTRGHSPNVFFDEAWHLQTYPAVAAAVRNGQATSGFDSYCRAGFRNRSPHWLFDEMLYRTRYPDLTDEAFAAADLANGYDHYLTHGARERRTASIFFDAMAYENKLHDAERPKCVQIGAFQHYLSYGAKWTSEPRTTLLFDPLWYLQRYPKVAEAISQRTWRCALHHYLANDAPTEYDPLPEFSEKDYLALYPDIAAAVERHDRRNGYQHFLLHGAAELRSPSPAIDLRFYADHDEVRDALYRGEFSDPFQHYLAVGRDRGLLASPPVGDRITEGQARALFSRKAVGLLPLFGRRPIDFTCRGKPDVSIVVVTHNAFALTAITLASVRTNLPLGLQLVVIDNGSTDELRFLDRYFQGANIVHFDTEVPITHCRNAATSFASADNVIFVGNDLELAPGAISCALDRLASDPQIGAVGAKVLRADGLLQEAGCILWGDGATSAYMQGAPALAPEANFVRDVDYCSSIFLAVRASALQQLEGFDTKFVCAAYQDADLCRRIAAAGGRVVYDPSVVVHRHGLSAPARAPTVEDDRRRFLDKHAELLRSRRLMDPKATVFARRTPSPAKRILFFEDTVPLRAIGSGFVRSNDIIWTMHALGYEVTVFPLHDRHFNVAAIFRDMPDSVEAMYDQSILNLPSFLDSRRGYYDLLWIARTHNLNRIHEVIERVVADHERPPQIVLDTEAIESTRDAMRATIMGQETAFDLDAAMHREFANVQICNRLVAVSAAEVNMLRDLTQKPVAAIGHMRRVQPTPRRFQERAGMLFLGAIHEVDTPNYDGLCWFVDHVLPLIERSLKWETRLTVAGYVAPTVSLDRFRDHVRVTMCGEVSDATPLYDRHRLFVAPTRFAAGVPYKVHEAASFGLPVVATSLLCTQLGWDAGRDILAANATDPEQFAEHVVNLYGDAALWQRVREAAFERLRTENDEQRYAETVRAVVEG